MKKSNRPAARKAAKSKRKPIARHDREGVKARPKRTAGRRRAKTPPPDLKRHYLDSFRRELSTTLKVLNAFPPAMDAFKPHERSHSAARLAHTFTVENAGALKAVRGEPMNPADLPRPPATFAEAVAAYESGARELIETVEAMPESRLFEEVTFMTGPRQLGEMPVHDVLWFLLMDSIHHRGQLSVYIRMAGGKVPSIYGPSADEPWN
jgi:uncharacterized damage-inducible protein DinB